MRSRVALTAAHRSSRLSMTRMKPTPDAATLREANIRLSSGYTTFFYVYVRMSINLTYDVVCGSNTILTAYCKSQVANMSISHYCEIFLHCISQRSLLCRKKYPIYHLQSSRVKQCLVKLSALTRLCKKKYI